MTEEKRKEKTEESPATETAEEAQEDHLATEEMIEEKTGKIRAEDSGIIKTVSKDADSQSRRRLWKDRSRREI